MAVEIWRGQIPAFETTKKRVERLIVEWLKVLTVLITPDLVSKDTD
jgi:hypothetical protein